MRPPCNSTRLGSRGAASRSFGRASRALTDTRDERLAAYRGALTYDRSAPRQVLLWLCASKIAALVLVLDPAGLVAFQLPKALASRAFEWAIAAALAFALVRYGRAIVPRHRAHVSVLGLLAAWAAAAVFAADRYVAIFGDPENYLGLTFIVDMVVLYLAVSVAVLRERDVFVLLVATLAAGAAAIAYGGAQSLGADPLAWAADPRTRPFASFGNPDHFGQFLSVFFGLALGLAIAMIGRTRLLATIGVIAALVISAIVATRATLLGVGAALVAAAFAHRTTTRALTVAAGAIAVVGLGFAFTPLGQRFIAGGVVSDRLTLWAIALRATLARPIFGYGPDNFRAAFAANRTAESLPLLGPGPQATAHNWILDASTTTGIVGLGALVVLLAVGTIELWRLATERPAAGLPLLLGWAAYWTDGLVAAASMAAVWYPWVALGCAVALRGARATEMAERHLPRLAAIALATIALIGAASGGRALQADRDAWSSEDAAHFGARDTALTFADRAAARDGGRADYWNRLGLAFEAEGLTTEAASAYREAASRGPYEAVYWANLARARARIAGSDATLRDESIGAARQATIVDPNAPVGHVALAEIATAFGHCDLARAEAARAAALEPGHDELVSRAGACR